MSVGILDAAVAEADKSGARFACRAGILVFFSLGVLGAGLAYRADMPHSQYANDFSPRSYFECGLLVVLGLMGFVVQHGRSLAGEIENFPSMRRDGRTLGA